MKTKCTPLDLLVAAGVLLLAFLLAFFPILFGKDAGQLKITSEQGESFYLMDEARQIEITSRGHTLVLCVDEEGAYVAEADCDDKICQHSGKIRKNGDIIVCAPAGVKIELFLEGEEADYVVG